MFLKFEVFFFTIFCPIPFGFLKCILNYRLYSKLIGPSALRARRILRYLLGCTKHQRHMKTVAMSASVRSGAGGRRGCNTGRWKNKAETSHRFHCCFFYGLHTVSGSSGRVSTSCSSCSSCFARGGRSKDLTWFCFKAALFSASMLKSLWRNDDENLSDSYLSWTTTLNGFNCKNSHARLKSPGSRPK